MAVSYERQVRSAVIMLPVDFDRCDDSLPTICTTRLSEGEAPKSCMGSAATAVEHVKLTNRVVASDEMSA